MTSYYTLEPGAVVRASDGTEIGKVEHVLADAASDIFDGLVIDCAPARRTSLRRRAGGRADGRGRRGDAHAEVISGKG